MSEKEKDSEEYGYTGDPYNAVISVFQPYLKKDEKILFSTGDGNLDESIIEKFYSLDDTKKGKAIAAAYMALLIVGILMCMLNHPIIGLLLIVLFISIPLVVSIGLLIMYCIKPSSFNCAITDKRVISMIGSHWNEIALKDISDTSVRKGKMIMVRTKGYSATSTTNYLVIYKVQDPLGVKQMLDEAIQRAKINEYQD